MSLTGSVLRRSTPFTNAVVAAMERLYPTRFADKSFDNVGLLFEAPMNTRASPPKNSVLLTIDLTTAVADEAIANGDSVIVAYHPIIFKALKSVTHANTQQSTLLRLASAGISVFSPHTAVDAAQGGNGDWLADIVTGTRPESFSAPVESEPLLKTGSYDLHAFPTTPAKDFKLNTVQHVREIVEPNAEDPKQGVGRLVRFKSPQDVSKIIDNFAYALGSPRAFTVALPQSPTISMPKTVTNIAICAGSGGGVVGGLQSAEVIVTGEMSHHEALALTENGKVVICVSHSNSERGFLSAAMQPRLSEVLKEEWAQKITENDDDQAFLQHGSQVRVSTADRDSFAYAVLR